MREKTSKLLSCVLCFVLVFSLLPVSAMAADSSTVPEPVETTYPADAASIGVSGNDAKPVESIDKPAKAPELEESVPTPVKDDVTGESESENVPPENALDVEQLQSRINALPNAERYAELNTDEKAAAANEYALIIAELEAQGFDPNADDFDSKCVDAGLDIANLVAFAGILAGEITTLEGNNFDVSTSDEYAAAVDAINAADSGSFTITLKNDVSLNGDYTFTKNTTTIYGEGHTLSGGNNGLIHVGGSAAVNLGAADYSGSLVLSCGSAGPTVFLGSAGGSISMYNVSISNSGIFYGVQIQYGTFNMYGGSIKNCSSVTYGGGVLAIGGTFNMYGGEISDNEVSSYGGGIFA